MKEQLKRKSRPGAWKSGPDPILHAQYKTWLVHKAQARFRNEPYELSFEDYSRAWSQNDNWSQRGRASESLCMTRRDYSLPWRVDNIQIESRSDYISRGNSGKKGTNYRKRSQPNE